MSDASPGQPIGGQLYASMEFEPKPVVAVSPVGEDPEEIEAAGGGHVVTHGAPDGIPQIKPEFLVVPGAGRASQTTEQLTEAAGRAVGTVGPGRGSVYGTLVHSAFSDEVIGLGNANLSSEISYLNGAIVPYGTRGSIRLDVVEGSLSAPTSVYDLKTGSATLTRSRIQQIQSRLPGGSGVPVLPITPP